MKKQVIAKYLTPILLIAVCATFTKAQAVLSPDELKSFILKAEKAIAQYSETFKNLSAEETKIFEDYDKEGKLKETRRIKSIFVVYQSLKGGEVNEFRNVLEYNGKAVTRKDREIEKFFQKLAKSDSAEEEWRKVRDEGIRFDARSTAWGITLWQQSPFGKYKPFFEFAVVGREKIEGRDVLVIQYRQTKSSGLIKFNPTPGEWKTEPGGKEYNAPAPSAFRPFNAHLDGKIWLDAETAQIWRNEFKVLIHPAQVGKPIVALELEYEYQPSQFKILVPKKFAFTTYKIAGTDDKDLSVTKDRKMTFEYSKFSEFVSEVQNYKLDNKQ